MMNFQEIYEYYLEMLSSNLVWIVNRFFQNLDYGWIDTKVDCLTGEDFDQGNMLQGRQTVYAWIQGRALEALAGHLVWIQENVSDSDSLIASSREILETVYLKLEVARDYNQGHLYFFLDNNGRAFIPEKDNSRRFLDGEDMSGCNYSDLFGAKGMYAAAKFLGDAGKLELSKQYCDEVIDSIRAGNFVSDQYFFRSDISESNDIMNSLGPYMICLSMVTNLLSEDEKYATEGMRLLSHVLDKHINISGQWDFGEKFDCVENIDENELPKIKNGIALSDPGHSLEFTGLALKFLRQLQHVGIGEKYLSKISVFQEILIKAVIHNFKNGFVPEAGGICKSYDLVKRQVIDSHMPWWSLPEAMRAVCYAMDVCREKYLKDELERIFCACHDDFSRNYIRSDFHFVAIQTLGSDGKPAVEIPAVPDVDPGYHTGLSIIDCLKLWPFKDFRRFC